MEPQDAPDSQEWQDNGKDIAIEESKRKTLRTQRLLKFIWLASSLIIAAFLGWTMVVGIWTSYRGVFSVIGFVAAVASTVGAAYAILIRQTDIAEHENKLVELYADRARLAAKHRISSDASLRIYRIDAKLATDRYRKEASQNRRVGNTLQWFIIIGAVVAASSTSAAAAAISSMVWFKWVAAAMSMVVAIASSASGFFKYRERGIAKQQTADLIARETKAMELGIRDYKEKDSDEKLRIFAERVEDIIEEQRKRELQLEESSRESENRDTK